MNRFVIANNAFGNSNQTLIIQTSKPQAIIECIAGRMEFTTPYQHYSFVNIHGEEEDWTLRVHYMHREPGHEPQDIIPETLLKRAWRYYSFYMKMLDRQNLNNQS